MAPRGCVVVRDRPEVGPYPTDLIHLSMTALLDPFHVLLSSTAKSKSIARPRLLHGPVSERPRFPSFCAGLGVRACNFVLVLHGR